MKNLLGQGGWDDYIGVFIVVGYIIYSLFRWIFKPKNEKLDEFLKSLDVEEDEEVEIPPLPKPKASSPPPPSVKITKTIKHPIRQEPLYTPTVRHQPLAHEPLYIPTHHKQPTTQVAVQEHKRVPKKQTDLLTPGNIQQAIVVQTILNKPKGAWW